jgi:hypothetical protein
MSRTVASGADFRPRALGKIDVDVDVITAGAKPAAIEIQLTA